MQVDTDEPEIIERVAALGKAEVVCCAWVPGPRGQRMQEVGRRTFDVLTELIVGTVWIPATT